MAEQVSRIVMEVRGSVVGVELVEVLVGVVDLGEREIGEAKRFVKSDEGSERRGQWSTCAFRDFLCDKYLQLTLIN